MTKQEKIIGNHPDNTHKFGVWLSANDLPHTDTKCHRELTELNSQSDELIEWIAKKLIDHHYTDYRLSKLKEKFGNLGFDKYAEQHRKLPRADKTKKGNGTEVLLIEYIQATKKKELIKVFKLRYNPNVDQSIKGDDTLMVDLYEEDGVEKIKMFLGESKFRTTPAKKAIDDITNSLSKDTLPLSYSFLVEETAKTDEELAEKLDDYIVQDIKDRGNLAYAGLLLSDNTTSRKVETHLNSENENLVFISIGIENPEGFINSIFAKAEELISNPEEL